MRDKNLLFQTTEDGMIIAVSEKYGSKNIICYMNEPSMIIDRSLGTVLRYGDVHTANMNARLAKMNAAYAGIQKEMRPVLQLITFDRYKAGMGIEAVCTLMNYFMNSLSFDQMNEILLANEDIFNSKILKLQEAGF